MYIVYVYTHVYLYTLYLYNIYKNYIYIIYNIYMCLPASVVSDCLQPYGL